MAGRRLGALVLTETEKSELMALAARPKTAQTLAELKTLLRKESARTIEQIEKCIAKLIRLIS